MQAGAALGFALLQGLASAQQPWIDVHVHLLGGPPGRADYGAAIGAAVSAMNESGARTTVIMPPPQVKGMALHDWRDYASLLEEHPGRFAFLGGGGTLNVMLHDPANAQPDAARRAQFERVAQEILAAGAAGFGEIAAHHLSLMQHHPYEWVAPDHPLLLLLADVAARSDSVIDLHLDLVMRDMSTPPRIQGDNPGTLRENFAAFERLLAHDRRAKIVWAHAGSHPLASLTPSLARQLLGRHPNLYMSLRMPGRMPVKPEGGGPPKVPSHFAVGPGGAINPEWLQVLQDFPDRFVIGSDQFMANPRMTGSGPGLHAARFNDAARALVLRFLEQLPPELAQRIALENAARLYRIQASR